MGFLVPDNTRVEHGLTINEKIIPDGNSLKPNRKLSNGTGKVQWITIHNTDDIREAYGTTDAEQYVRATYNGAMGGVTVHYFIDDDDCWQMLKEDEIGYHAADGASGPGNSTSLAIEIIMTGNQYRKDMIAEDRGARLAAILLHRHGLGIDRLTTHNRWYPPKYCPAYILPHWDSFKTKVEKNLYDIEHCGEPMPEIDVLYRIQTGAFRVKEYAEMYSESLKKDGFDNFIVKDDPYYKVQVGAYRNKKNAEAYRNKIRDAGYECVIVEIRDEAPEKYTADDARLALRISVGLEEAGEEDLKHLDIDGDGVITAADSREILKRSVT